MTPQEKLFVKLDKQQYKYVVANDILSRIQGMFGSQWASMKVLSQAKRIIMDCQPNLAVKLAEKFGLPRPRFYVPEHPQCLRCGKVAAELTLSTCKHPVCKRCFNQHLEDESEMISTDTFRVLCFHDTYQAPISVDDMCRYAIEDTNKALQRASIG